MLIDFNDFLAHNLLSCKYGKIIFPKNFYLFFLGLSFAVGDFKLILATLVFILAMVASYRLKIRSLSYYLNYLSKILNLDEQKLISSIGIAGISSIFVYFSVSVYGELEQSWLAFFIITQTLFSACGIAFFTKKLSSASGKIKEQTPTNFDELILQLDSKSSLHRLWVINQITSMWEEQLLTPRQIRQWEEYLILLKNIELEPLILDKIEHSLRKISALNSQPLNIPRKNSTSSQQHPLPVMQTVNYIKGK
jgi:hypothetical protein